MLKQLTFFTTRELTLIAVEYIRMQEQLNDFSTPHMKRNTMVSSFS